MQLPPSASSVALLLLSIVATLLPCDVLAATFNVVSYSTPAALQGMNVDQDPYDISPNCTSLGVCVPYTFTLANRTMIYWCGWSTSKRTDYYVNGPSNVVVQTMRWSSLSGCGFNNISLLSQCEAIAYSSCSNNSCYVRTTALAFSDEQCIVIANNNVNKSTRNMTLQVYQYYDSPRYYGSIFVILYTIIIIGGVCWYIGWTCYKEITSPPDRLVELRSFEAQLKSAEEETDPALYKLEPDRDTSDPGSFKDRVKDALHKAKNLVMRNKGASQA